MQKFVCQLLPLFLVASCATTPYRYRADYDYGIRKAKVNHQIMPLSDGRPLTYQDDWLDVSFLPGADGVYMNLLNTAQENLHIVWDQSVIIYKERALKVFHNGVKFSQAHDFMPNAVIPPETYIEDHISPAAFVSYRAATDYRPGGWEQARIIPHLYTQSPEHEYDAFKKAVEAMNNTELYGLLLTLEKGNEVRTYQFDFEVASARISEISPVVQAEPANF